MRINILIFFKILMLFQFLLVLSQAKKICYQCQGINCQRTSYNKTEQCVDEMDACVTIFDGQTLQAQGCLEQLPIELRRKCDSREASAEEDTVKPLSECYTCLSSFCNNVGPDGYECIQCDSEKDEKCRSNPTALTLSKCSVSRAMNMYCFVNDNGKRTVRGCVGNLKEQSDCLSSTDCLLCSPSDIRGCNQVQIKDHNDEGDGGNGSNGGGGGENGSNGGGGDGGNGSNGGGGDGNGSNGGENDGNGGGNGNGNSGGSHVKESRILKFLSAILCLASMRILLL